VLEALGAGDLERVEEAWLEALERRPVPWRELLEVRRELWKAGHRRLALTLLELLADTLEEAGDPRGALEAVRELVRLTDRPPHELLERLERDLAAARAGSPSLDAVLAHYRLAQARRPLETLEEMETWLDHDVGTPVEVRERGVGRVVELNLTLGNVLVDTGSGRPLSVPLGAVRKFLRVLPEGSFLRRKVEDPEGLAAWVLERPGEALVHLLEGFDGPVGVPEIKAALAGLVPQERWARWWSTARKHPRVVSQGTGARLRYAVTASADAAAEAELAALRAAPPRKRLPLARRLAQRGPEAAEAAAEVLHRTLARAEGQDPGLAWETAATLEAVAGASPELAAVRARLLETTQPLELLAGIEDRPAREAALEAIRERLPAWAEVWSAWMLREEHPAVLDRLARTLAAEGHEAALDRALEAIFREPERHPHRFVWACEAMVAADAPATLRARRTPSLLERLPDTLTKAAYAPVRARARRLFEGGQVALAILLESASPQQARRFLERVTRTGALEAAGLRRLENAVRQVEGPEAAGVGGAPALVATRAAVEARREELRRLLEVEIPKTLKGIQAAAAEGDLRENFEYHMLRDRQELLSARAARLQRELAAVRILEPGSADTSRVNVGTVVHLEALEGDGIEPITILGPWDADIERRIFADQSEIAQGLLGRRVGDEVEVEGRRARIVRIEPWTG